MMQNEKQAYNDEGKGDQQYDGQADPYRVVHVVIAQVDKRGKAQADEQEDQTANEFPSPGNNQQGNQDKGRHQMESKTGQLLPKG